MIEIVNWQQWLKEFEQEKGHPLMRLCVACLIENEKCLAVWVSGSRATHQADAYSDLDIRIHAPTWTADDMTQLLREVDSTQCSLFRLSRLSSVLWNYECLFAGAVPIDLLVFAEESPTISADSVVFKCGRPLKRTLELQLIKETIVTLADVKTLVDGAFIDQRKFEKLLARDEQLAAWFLLDGQQFSALRLGYIAARGLDCGGKQHHTLASLKLLYATVTGDKTDAVANSVAALSREGTLEEKIARVEALLQAVITKLEQRFPKAAFDYLLAAGLR